MSERTRRECAYLFCKYVIELYGDIYLRHPTRNDIEQLYAAHEVKHGLPGMLDNNYCTHWEWTNYPNAWRGQSTRGDHGVPTIILEVVASHDLWFWHAFFGMAGSNNDLNVLGASPIFNDIFASTRIGKEGCGTGVWGPQTKVAHYQTSEMVMG
uniref:Uncharacterized protein n=1 Tax=Lactuca sativa TaxID=4236 RepID=A0A9R1UJW6_LACSA|nr:hypothetical protein LSAT_V11C900488140 [Lactuca sativa]